VFITTILLREDFLGCLVVDIIHHCWWVSSGLTVW